MRKRVIELWFNWSPSVSTNQQTYPEEYSVHKVGENGVTAIYEHQPKGEGDKWCYVVQFENGNQETIFNPNRVFETPVN